MRPRINAVRDLFGLGPIASVDDFLRRCDLMLVTTAEPFEYPRSDWGDGVLLVGANAWEPPQDTPVWLDEVDRPIVLVTTSSERQDDEALVRTALEALADEPVFVVATMPAGGALDRAAGLVVPANARVERFVPHGPVLDRAEVSGAGVRLPAKRLTPSRLRDAVREAMGRRDGAGAVREGFASAGGAATAADAIERRLLDGSAALS